MAGRRNLAVVETEPRYRLLPAKPDEPGLPASPHQAAIFDVMPDPRSGSFNVVAVAGAGKTTVLKNALRYLPPGAHVQGFAFNTDAAKSLKDALAEVGAADGAERYRNVRMGTFHSVCYGAILRHLNLKADRLKPDGGKVGKILKKRLIEADHELYASFCARLVGLAKGEGIGALVPDTEERWWDLIEHHALSLEAEEATEGRAIEIARRTLAYSNAVAKPWTDAKGVAHEPVIDFDDMLYLVLLWRLRLWANDVVFVDEAQDVNPTRRAIVRLALKRTGRLFAVGDPRQSIYGFTGASTDAMDLIATEFRTGSLPLTVSYRCARAVVERARRFVEYIEPAPSAPEGEVRDDVPLDEALTILTDEDAVLCRQTAPLIDLAYKLIGKGRGVKLLGKDIGEGLISLIRSQRARGIDRLIEKLEAWREREVARWVARGEDEKADAVADRVASILTVVQALPETARTIPGLERAIEKMFRIGEADQPTGPLLTLATVHKAKGLEWPTVAILRPDLMPGKTRVEWAAEQEKNLMYVAATRAKTTLLYLQP